MKKILSVFLAILVMVTSCVCALTVFAADEPCKDHVVTVWANNNTKNHLGTCTVCNETVHEAHKLVAKETTGATCTTDGYTYYTCACGYAEERDFVRSKGHNIISTTYDYDENNDGKFNELDVNYTKSFVCANDCGMASVKGTIGNSNYCTLCQKYMLLGKKVVNATCTMNDYVIYNCSNPECAAEYTIEGTDRLECKYEASVVAPTCTAEGYTIHTCVMCGDAYKDTYLPKKGHKINRAGTTATYVYSDDKCTITGYCSVCTHQGTVEETKLFTTPEKCTGGCEKAIHTKYVTFPASCEESISIKTNCNSLCGTQEIKAVPLGHSAKTVTYEYHDNGELKSLEVDCYNCDSKAAKGEEYNLGNVCVICSSTIEKRVVVAPTCDANGYTKVTCPVCGEYTESTKPSLSHGGDEAEWIFDRSSGTYIFKSNCTKNDCNGYTFKSAIGTAGKCVRCGKDALTYKKVVYSDCASKGYTSAQCSYCGSYDGYDIKTELPHNNVSETKTADCENGGATKNTCKNCYYTVETNKTEALGHIGGVEKITYDSTKMIKTIDGFCERCNTAYDEDKSYEAKEVECAKGHANCITSILVVKPDCKSMSAGYTRVFCNCGDKYYDKDIVAASHKYGKWTIVLNPTCVEEGLRTRTCEVCSSVEQDIIPANQTVNGEPKHKYVVMVKGYEATCTEPGLSDEMYCSSCGDYQRSKTIPALGHIFDPSSKNKDFCDRCDTYVIGEGDGAVACSCMCHNRDGLAKFFFKMILFFCQIFGINQKCDCGTIHY